MIGALAKKIFGTANDRRLKTYAPKVNAINALEADVEALTDDALKDRTRQFREELAAGTHARPHVGRAGAVLVVAIVECDQRARVDVERRGGAFLFDLPPELGEVVLTFGGPNSASIRFARGSSSKACSR